MKNQKIFTLLGMLALFSVASLFTSCKDDEEKPKEAFILEFAVTNAGAEANERVEGVISGTTILVTVPFETDVTALITDIKVSDGASVVPATGTAVNFSSVRSFIVTNGEESNTYQVTVELADPTSPVITEIGFKALTTGDLYSYSINQISKTITVTLNNLQSPLVEVESVVTIPAGATWIVSGTDDIINLIQENNTITVSFAGTETVYSIVGNITMAGFNPENTTILLNLSGTNTPSTIIADGNETTRSAAFDGRYVFVASRKDGNQIYYWDLQNATSDPLTLPFGEVVSGGAWVISDVRVNEGHIYASNMVNAQGSTFKVYRWASLTAAPEPILSYDVPSSNIRLGDAISIIGSPPQNGYIFASNFPFPDTQLSEFYVFNFNESTTPTPTVMKINPLVGLVMGQYGRVNPVPGEPDKLLVTGAQMGIGVMDFSGNVLVETREPAVQSRSFDPQVFTYNGGRYLSFTVNREWEDKGAYMVIINIAEGANIQEAIGLITANTIEQKQVFLYNFSRQSSENWVGANNAVQMGPDGKPRVMAFALKHGFIVKQLSN